MDTQAYKPLLHALFAISICVASIAAPSDTHRFSSYIDIALLSKGNGLLF